MKLPFKIISRSRWDRIRMALDAYPRLVDSLGSQLSSALADAAMWKRTSEEEYARAERAELSARQSKIDAGLLEVVGESGERLIQRIVRY